jgi:ATP-dependent helicase HrpA
MREWVDVHRQLLELVEQEGMKPQTRRDDYAAIHRALLAGLLSNVAFRADAHEYTVAGGGKAHLWPGSGTFAAKPKWIVAAEQVETSRRYVRGVARIKPEWIESLGSHLVNRSYSEPHWVRAAGSVMAFEKVSLSGLTIVPRRRVAYGSIDPKLCREQLIQHGLVEGELDTRAEFFKHNAQLLAEVEALQTRARRRDLLLGEDARYEFYDRRLPAEVFDAVRLEKWRRSVERKQPKLLFMRREDLMRDDINGVDANEFPEAIEMRNLRLPLEYRFDPASDQDGVTLTVPREALGQLDRQRLGWLVPGLLEEKVVALIKSLPKPLRRQFVPAPDTARKVVEQIRFGEGSFAAAVAETLTRLSGQHVPVEAFQQGDLPPHLRMNVRVIDSAGAAVATSRDVGELHARLVEEARQTVSQQSDPRWQRDGITAWDFGELPLCVPIERQGLTLQAYPTLIDAQNSVSLRLVDTSEKAQRRLRGGLRRLFVIAASRELKSQASWLPGMDQMRLYAATLSDAKDFSQQVAELIADRALFTSRAAPRTADEFAAAVKLGRSRIAAATQDVAQLLGPLMKTIHEATLSVERATAPRFAAAVDDVRSQLQWLTPEGFLLSTPWPWLVHLPRYLRAIAARMEKLTSDGLVRDQKNLQSIAPRWRQFRELAENLRQQDQFDPQLEHYGWMLEEYRVSLFAQKLGTSLTVSEKRLDEQWTRIQQA